MRVPFVDLSAQYRSIKPEIDEAIANVIADTAFIGGKYVQAFEEKFAALYGVKHVISCANGTDSLYVIMKMLGIGPGDEVITPANSWISSAETISQTGARPVFIDVLPDLFSLDENQLSRHITSRTKAIIVVHLQGQPCEMDSIAKICKTHSVKIIEDCAQAHFSEYKGIKAGLLGEAASFSFFPGKNLGAYGDAGCMITNNDELAEKLRMFARHGALKKHEHKIEGINSRMDGMQASILTTKLTHILQWTDARIRHARRYDQLLSGIEEISIPLRRSGCKHSFHLYVIRARKRNELAEFLRENGIETAIHYPKALPNLEAYRYLNLAPDAYPVATGLEKEILSLPMYPEMTEEIVHYVADCIRKFYLVG